MSNGLDWSTDGRRAYYIDSPTRGVDTFDYAATDTLSGRRRFISIDGPGVPDGLTLDAGGVWVAIFNGGSAVHRYSPDGSLTEVISLPVSKVTACTFGGRTSTRYTSRRPGRASWAEPNRPPDRCSPCGQACEASPFVPSPAECLAARPPAPLA